MSSRKYYRKMLSRRVHGQRISDYAAKYKAKSRAAIARMRALRR